MLKVLCQNMYFESVDLIKRIDTFGKLVQLELPNIITLQEMTGPMTRLLRPYIEKEYQCFVAESYEFVDYCTVILVHKRHEAKALPFFPFPSNTSRLGKRGIFVVYLVKDDVYVATTHLDSGDEMIRYQQFKQCFAFLSLLKCSKAILTGDMNLFTDQRIIVRHWYDSGSEPTYDPKHNPYVKVGHMPKRPDRIYVKGGMASTEVIKLPISDHYGLLSTIDCNILPPLQKTVMLGTVMLGSVMPRAINMNSDWKEFRRRCKNYIVQLYLANSC